MDPRRVAVITLALGLLAACGSTTLSPTSQAVASATGSPAGSRSTEPVVVPTIDPNAVTRPALTCGDAGQIFSPEALQGPGLAELGPDPAAEVLRTVIAEEGLGFPTSGWHRVVDQVDGVTFVAKGDAETPWWAVTVGELGGTLQATGYGQCNLGIVAPDGVSFARWWLDPDSPAITPASTTIDILLREQACASGRSPEGRVLVPTIVTTGESIVIAVGIQKRPGGQDCPGNPAFPVELELPDAIGSRSLFDASEFPPRPVTSADPGE